MMRRGIISYRVQLQEKVSQMTASQSVDAMSEFLLKLLKCPVCSQPMTGPIETCKDGHSVCMVCMETIDKCSQCGAQFVGGRNYIAEGLAEAILYPCLNAEAGCSLRVLKKDLTKHGSRCPFRKYNCFRREDDGCPWTGRRSEILRHFKDKHEKYVKTGDTITLSLQPSSRDAVYPPLVISAHGEIFCYRNKYNGDRQTTFRFVQFIGPEDRASDFRYRFEFQSEDNNHELIYSTTTPSDLEDVNSIMDSRKCLELSCVMTEECFQKFVISTHYKS